MSPEEYFGANRGTRAVVSPTVPFSAEAGEQSYTSSTMRGQHAPRTVSGLDKIAKVLKRHNEEPGVGPTPKRLFSPSPFPSRTWVSLNSMPLL